MFIHFEEEDLSFDGLKTETYNFKDLPSYRIIGNTIVLDDGSKIIFNSTQNLKLEDIIITNPNGQIVFKI